MSRTGGRVGTRTLSATRWGGGFRSPHAPQIELDRWAGNGEEDLLLDTPRPESGAPLCLPEESPTKPAMIPPW
eukprot:COSAG05_NODE_16848_length_337_cov_0.869748_1_plen_72_part_01